MTRRGSNMIRAGCEDDVYQQADTLRELFCFFSLMNYWFYSFKIKLKFKVHSYWHLDSDEIEWTWVSDDLPLISQLDRAYKWIIMYYLSLALRLSLSLYQVWALWRRCWLTSSLSCLSSASRSSCCSSSYCSSLRFVLLMRAINQTLTNANTHTPQIRWNFIDRGMGLCSSKNKTRRV